MAARRIAWLVLASCTAGCQPRRAAGPPPSAPDAGTAPEAARSSACLMPARDLWRFMADQVRMVPQIRNQVVEGWRLYQLVAGSPLASAGFREGDLIVAIDGRRLALPTMVPAVGTTKVVFTIERGGQVVNLPCWLR